MEENEQPKEDDSLNAHCSESNYSLLSSESIALLKMMEQVYEYSTVELATMSRVRQAHSLTLSVKALL